MNQRFSILTLGLLLPLLLLVALSAATATAEPVNALTRQRDLDSDGSISAADITAVAQHWGWVR